MQAQSFALIKCTEGNFEVKMGLPDGTAKVVRWNKENNFTAKVPTVVTYRDPVTRKILVAEDAGNWAQHVLNKYSCLQLVEIVEPPAVEAPAVVQPKREAPAESPKPTPPRRGRPRKQEVKDETETPV